MMMKLLVWTKTRRCHYEKALARLGVNKEKARTLVLYSIHDIQSVLLHETVDRNLNALV